MRCLEFLAVRECRSCLADLEFLSVPEYPEYLEFLSVPEYPEYLAGLEFLAYLVVQAFQAALG